MLTGVPRMCVWRNTRNSALQPPPHSRADRRIGIKAATMVDDPRAPMTVLAQNARTMQHTVSTSTAVRYCERRRENPISANTVQHKPKTTSGGTYGWTGGLDPRGTPSFAASSVKAFREDAI